MSVESEPNESTETTENTEETPPAKTPRNRTDGGVLCVRNLDNVTIADTEGAHLVHKLITGKFKRERAGDAIQALADEIHYSAWTVYHWLAGRQKPNPRAIAALRKVVGKA